LATEGLQKEFGKERCFDTPLSEDGIVGAAIGMALNGMKPPRGRDPVPRLHLPAFDQIVSEAAKFRYRSGGQYTCPMVIPHALTGGGIRGGLYHSAVGRGLLLPHARPQGRHSLDALRRQGLAAGRDRGPRSGDLLEPKALYRSIKGEVPAEPYSVPLSTLRSVREGSHVTVVLLRRDGAAGGEGGRAGGGEGHRVPRGRSAHAAAARRGGRARSGQSTGRIVVVHEAAALLRLRAEISAMIAENIIEYMEAPVARVTGLRHALPQHARAPLHARRPAHSRRDRARLQLLARLLVRRRPRAPKHIEAQGSPWPRLEFKLPDIGEGIAEGEIVSGLVKPGDVDLALGDAFADVGQL